MTDGGGVVDADQAADFERHGGAASGRRLWRALWLGVAGFSAVAVIAAVGVPISGLLAKQTHTETWTANHAIDAVEVSVDSADVTVRPSAGATAESLRGSLTWSLTRPQVTEAWEGDTLVVTERCAARRLFEGDSCSATLDLAVPSAVPVHVNADSGAVTVDRMTGGLRVEAVSGDIELRGTTGDVWARVESGSIDADRLSSPHVDAQTISGDLTLGFAAAPDTVSASVTSGSVSVTVPPGTTYRVTGRTVSGDRQIADGLVNDGSTHSIDINSESGDADLGYAGQ